MAMLLSYFERAHTERQPAQLATQRFARIFAALRATNEAIMRAATRDELFERVCEAAVGSDAEQAPG
jgi:hypothetical protein